jgi:hypothetical protein
MWKYYDQYRNYCTKRNDFWFPPFSTRAMMIVWRKRRWNDLFFFSLLFFKMGSWLLLQINPTLLPLFLVNNRGVWTIKQTHYKVQNCRSRYNRGIRFQLHNPFWNNDFVSTHCCCCCCKDSCVFSTTIGKHGNNILIVVWGNQSNQLWTKRRRRRAVIVPSR